MITLNKNTIRVNAKGRLCKGVIEASIGAGFLLPLPPHIVLHRYSVFLARAQLEGTPILYWKCVLGMVLTIINNGFAFADSLRYEMIL